jgi:catechol 2,3-dioxygenase-like lactoylglutathione lyase family enzyme
MPRHKARELEFTRVRLLVKDFDRSWKFYRDALGLTPVPGHGSGPYGEFEWGGKPFVSLFDRTEMARAVGLAPGRSSPKAVGQAAIIFETEDVDATVRRLRSRGVSFLRGPTDRKEWGIRTAHLRDPEGNLIEIYGELRRKGS